MEYLPIQVTSSSIPTASKYQILFVLPFSGTPTPLNRLAVGVYFSTKNTSRATGAPPYIWQNIMTLLTASIEALIALAISGNNTRTNVPDYPVFLSTTSLTYNLSGSDSSYQAIPNHFTISYILLAGQGLRQLTPNNDWELNTTTNILTFNFTPDMQSGLEVKIFLKQI